MTKPNEKSLKDTVAEVLVGHAEQAAAYRDGALQSFGFLFGQVMKETAGKADAQLVNRELQRQLS